MPFESHCGRTSYRCTEVMNGSERHQTRAAGTGRVPAANSHLQPGRGRGKIISSAAEAGVGISEEEAAWSLPASEEVGPVPALRMPVRQLPPLAVARSLS